MRAPSSKITGNQPLADAAEGGAAGSPWAGGVAVCKTLMGRPGIFTGCSLPGAGRVRGESHSGFLTIACVCPAGRGLLRSGRPGRLALASRRPRMLAMATGSRMRRRIRALTGAAVAASLLGALVAPPALAAPAGPAGGAAHRGGLISATADGLVQGKHAEGIDQFLGVPYAAPPVGPLRWQAPQPVHPWTGVRSATAYGNRCPQLASGNGPREDTENCLFLNVFTPAGYHPGAGRGGLPVLFMIHGGGLSNGAGDQHDGSLIVNTDHIVGVSINYRLGAFGLLDVPALGTSRLTANGNFGLLDQEAALRWVRRNIAAFGGDPGRVTIAGESAGGWSICALMTSPLARGLFSAGIMESGSCASRPPADAQSAGLAFAAQAGCPDAATAAACLRGEPETALLTDSASYSPEFASGGPEIPVPPAQAVADGDEARVPLLMGTNHDEGRTFAQG